MAYSTKQHMLAIGMHGMQAHSGNREPISKDQTTKYTNFILHINKSQSHHQSLLLLLIAVSMTYEPY